MEQYNLTVKTPEQQNSHRQSAVSSLFRLSDGEIRTFAQDNHHKFIVATRIKPKEKPEQSVKIILNKNCKQMSIESGKNLKNMYYGSTFKTFKMDNIFHEKTKNETIFEDLVKHKLSLLKSNCNVSLMAYGATNSGKTYTIFGNQNKLDDKGKIQGTEGLAYLSSKYLMEELFCAKYKFYFSYLQIYNQNIQDCLIDNNLKKHYLNIFQDHTGKINIPDLTKVQVENYAHLCSLINKGNKIRAESSNNVNHVSSRSHAILQLDIFSIEESQNQINYQPIDVNFMIIDLAGSQKSSPYFQQSQQITLKEGSNINRSLLALGNCIKNLQNGENHIPYRDSKLTRILKQNLSGGCQNILIACISQHINQYEESMNTLQYASKAYKIEAQQNLSKQSNRRQLIKICCQHCKMKIQFDYICSALKKHHYQIVDMLDKDKQLHSLNEENDKNRNQNYYLTNTYLKQENNQIDKYQLQQLQFDEQRIRNFNQNKPIVNKKDCKDNEKKALEKQNIPINIQQTFKSQNQKQIDSYRMNKITLKVNKQHKKKHTDTFVKNIKLDLNIKQKKSFGEQEKTRPFLQLIKKETSRSRLHSNEKTTNPIQIKQQRNADGKGLSLQVSSIKGNDENIILDNMSIPPFFEEMNLDLSELYDKKQRNNFIQQNFCKDLQNIKHIKQKRNSDSKQFSLKIQDLNITNIYQKKDDGPRTIRCSSNILNNNSSRQRFNSMEGKKAKRMKPDETQMYPSDYHLTIPQQQNYGQFTITSNECIQNNNNKKIKIVGKLR